MLCHETHCRLYDIHRRLTSPAISIQTLEIQFERYYRYYSENPLSVVSQPSRAHYYFSMHYHYIIISFLREIYVHHQLHV